MKEIILCKESDGSFRFKGKSKDIKPAFEALIQIAEHFDCDLNDILVDYLLKIDNTEMTSIFESMLNDLEFIRQNQLDENHISVPYNIN